MSDRVLTPVKRAFGLLAALAFLHCSGAQISSKTSAEQTPASSMDSTPVAAPDFLAVRRSVLIDSGRIVFQTCAFCHGGKGQGGRGPNLANSDYVMGGRERLIRTVLEGVHNSIRVNGVRWKSGEMVGWAGTYDDFKIAAVLTYIRTALNDSLVTSCIPEDVETGTWASCKLVARNPEDIATDSISVREVAESRSKINLRPK